MDDGCVYFRVVQYLESQGETDTTKFELRKMPDDTLTFCAWRYDDIQTPDLEALRLLYNKNEVVAVENLKNVRKLRNELLAATDYLFLNDAVDDDKTDAALYRRRLRDLPQTISNPQDRELCLALFPHPPQCLKFLNKHIIYGNKKPKV